jgi:orotate phosphoribosyltransferase
MQDHQLSFVDLALSRDALRFGSFKLKSGRESPYFFNAGLFSDGEALASLGRCYAAALVGSSIAFDMVFGPAYKGIPLVASTAIALKQHYGRSVPFAFNRKEAKAHGEGGSVIGSPLRGRVAIIDDVITAGTAIRESIEIIRGAGAQPVTVVLALDRQERGTGERSAVQEVESEFGIRCVSVVTLTDLIEALAAKEDKSSRISVEQLASLRAYRERYGVR